ncbi:MAG: hypothetical protein IPP57_17255 [Candidatus Obscuribacter sp.]|nr:hypothetical protein [Candidatus Obscuribacter sp.]
MSSNIANTSDHLVFDPAYKTDLAAFGLNNPFALDRGEMVLAKISEEIGKPATFIRPVPLTLEQVGLVHTPDYLESLKHSSTWAEILRSKIPCLIAQAGYLAPQSLFTRFLMTFCLKPVALYWLLRWH